MTHAIYPDAANEMKGIEDVGARRNASRVKGVLEQKGLGASIGLGLPTGAR